MTRRKLLAVVHFVKHYRHYLYGSHFIIRTDHGSLRWLYNFKEPEGQIARWLETLGMYDFKIIHRPGRQHSNADALSRLSCRQCGWTDGTTESVSAVTRSQQKQHEEAASPEDNSWLTTKSVASLKEEQLQDPVLSKIVQWKVTEAKPKWEKISAESKEVKAYWGMWRQLQVKNGVLYKQWDTDMAGQCLAVCGPKE